MNTPKTNPTLKSVTAPVYAIRSVSALAAVRAFTSTEDDDWLEDTVPVPRYRRSAA